MPKGTKDIPLALGIGSLAFSILGFLLAALDFLEGRRETVLGAITIEGLSLIALWIGLSLLSLSVVPRIGSRFSSLLAKRSARRKGEHEIRLRQVWARMVLPHLSKQEHDALKALLRGPGPVENVPSGFAGVLREGSYNRKRVYGLDVSLIEPIESFFREQSENARAARVRRIVQAIKEADKAKRAVLWCFARPHLEEPVTALIKNPYYEAITQLSRDNVLRAERPWGSLREPVTDIHLEEDARVFVEGLLLGRKAVRTSVKIQTKPARRSAEW